jgi:hypothetical protein
VRDVDGPAGEVLDASQGRAETPDNQRLPRGHGQPVIAEQRRGVLGQLARGESVPGRSGRDATKDHEDGQPGGAAEAGGEPLNGDGLSGHPEHRRVECEKTRAARYAPGMPLAQEYEAQGMTTGSSSEISTASGDTDARQAIASTPPPTARRSS